MGNEVERTEGVRLPDMEKMTAQTELCPPDIRDLIFQTVDSRLTFDTMKEKVISWVSNKVASRKEMPVPMDIGRLKDVQGMTRFKRMNGMKSARRGIVATDVEEWGTTPGNVPQRKAKARAKAKAKAKASTAPGPKDGNGQGKERAWAKVKARLDCRVSATDAVSTAIVSPVARNGRPSRLSKMGSLSPGRNRASG